MPFTFSHPAIVLPFCKTPFKWVSFNGLVIGSMVPDFEFLLRLRETDTFGHTWQGIFFFDIPFAILLAFLFHIVIRNTLILHLPKFIRIRLSIYLSFKWNDYFNKNKIPFIAAVIVGIMLHIFLDAFTHYDGAIAVMYPFFSSEIRIMGQMFPVYFILQIALSAFGAIYTLWFILKLKRCELDVKQKKVYRFWLALITVTIFIFIFRLWADTFNQSNIDFIIALTGSFLYALVIVCSFYFKKYSILKLQNNPGKKIPFIKM